MTLSSVGRPNFLGPATSAICVAVVLSTAGSEPTERPLHQRVDELVSAGLVVPPAELADDATFLRRLFLDLTGSIPTSEEALAFLEDGTPGKRVALVEELLSRPEHSRHLATSFDVWLMERRSEAHVKTPGWRDFLEEAFAANRPYHEVVAEILSADGTADRNRDAARFYLDRLGEPHLVTRDVGRLFFGRDLQCAQCHDHPNIPDYLQRDYHGLYAFFGRTYLFQPDKKQPAVLAEHAAGGGEFKSVFTGVEDTSLPRVPLGSTTVPDPPVVPGQEYRVKPNPKDKKIQPIPTYSRRDQVAPAVTKSGNEAFDRNIANRLWAFMMGRGLVEPLDFHHASNPPVHPELLDLLAEEFAGMNYDIRAFLRELALTETYQRSSVMPSSDLVTGAGKMPSLLAALDTEESGRRLRSQAAADALEDAKAAWRKARMTALEPESVWQAAEKKRMASAEALQKASEALSSAEKSRDDVIAQTAEGETDPGLAKLEAAVEEARKKKGSAESELAKASEEAKKLRPAVEAEQAKVQKAAEGLETAQRNYEKAKSAWKLAQRKREDAQALVDHIGTVRASGVGSAALMEELAKQQAEVERLQELAGRLETAAVAAQALRAEAIDDEELVYAAAVLGERSLTAEANLGTAERSLAELRETLETAREDPGKRSEREAASLEELTARWTQAFGVGAFTHLSPEQFCLAMSQATGELEKYRVAGEADFTKKLAAQEEAGKEKKSEPGEDEKKEPAVRLTEADRGSQVDDYVQSRIDSVTKQYVSLFGGEAGLPQGDFFATADQALFLSNASILRGWLRPSGDNLSARLLKLSEPEALARELYLSILTRKPRPDEVVMVSEYLEARGDQRSEAVQELGWALLSSVEFRFKH